MRILILLGFLGCAFSLNSQAGVFGPPPGLLAAQAMSAKPAGAEASYSCDIVYPKGTGFISVRLALPSRKLEYKMGGMPGLYGPGRRFAKTLLASEVAEFRKLFASLKFFTVPKAGEKRAQGKDGEFWTVSAEEGGKKHVVTRLEPRADPYQAGLVKACDWLGSAANR